MKIYGPVPSWRLGNSLGVDLIEAKKGYSKTCSYNCLYCQLGSNAYKTAEPKYIKIPDIEFKILEKKINQTKPNYITFSGQGEPTLNLALGYAAKKIKQITNIPVAVLTNGSLVGNIEVRENLNKCDLAIVKIDAPNQQLFEKINQPISGIKLNSIIENIKLLKTRVAIQTLLFYCGNLTNADDKSIKLLIDIYKKINKVKPIELFLGTAYRPSDNEEINPISSDALKKIALEINKEAKIPVVYYKKNKPIIVNVGENVDSKIKKQNILNLLSRRPCTKQDLITRFGKENIDEILSDFIRDKQVNVRTKQEVIFYYAV